MSPLHFRQKVEAQLLRADLNRGMGGIGLPIMFFHVRCTPVAPLAQDSGRGRLETKDLRPFVLECYREQSGYAKGEKKEKERPILQKELTN